MIADMTAPIIFITVSDAGLVATKIHEALERLKADPASVVYWDEKGEPLASVLEAVSLFHEHTVVIVKEPDNAAVKVLTAYCENPSADKTVIIGSSKPLAIFRRAVEKQGGEVVEVGGKYARDVILSLISQSGVPFTGQAKQRLVEHIGEDVSQVPPILEALSEFYPGARIDVEQLTPFLSAPGEIKPWTLTDAIDRGPQGVAEALEMVGRLWSKQTPVGIVSILKAHMDRIWRLQKTGITNERDAADYLGMKGASTYPAKKAINLGRAYGSAAEPLLQMIAEVDAALRGGRNQWAGVPSRLTLEVLVARMCVYPRR